MEIHRGYVTLKVGDGTEMRAWTLAFRQSYGSEPLA
jgi:hypothetical protein